MNYIDELAIKIHQAAEPDAPPHEDMPLYRLYAVLMLAKGEQVTAEDVHNAWSAWAAEYAPQHRSLIPFNELDPRVRERDEPYVAAIHLVARRLPALAEAWHPADQPPDDERIVELLVRGYATHEDEATGGRFWVGDDGDWFACTVLGWRECQDDAPLSLERA